MKTTLYYFSATGNSLKVTRDLAGVLGNTKVVSIPKHIGKSIDVKTDAVGLIFPVYMWGPPLIIARFIKKMKVRKDTYVFAIVTYGGLSAGTLPILSKLFQKKGIRLKAGFTMLMPGNYTPFYNAMPKWLQKFMFNRELKRIKRIANIVRKRKRHRLEQTFFLISWILSGLLHGKKALQIPVMDKGFWVDENCNSCRICEKVCPVKNIRMKNKRPSWLHHCEQCLACLHWCPKKAIQWEKRTKKRRRYHHPKVKLSDLY
ncbi:MAG: EFR1 family ferrodoxin [Spirochaetes bacterium]|nr:EFR1 family ferrodoxin [Spirochaetota bacterium]